MDPKSSPIQKQSNKSPQTQQHEISKQPTDTQLKNPRDQSTQGQLKTQSGNSNKQMHCIHASLENPQFQLSSQDSGHVIVADQVAVPVSVGQHARLVELQTNVQRSVSPTMSESSQNDTFQSVGSSPVISPTTSQTHLDKTSGSQGRECTDGGEQNGRHAVPVQSQISQSKVSVAAVRVRRYETFFSKAPAK